MARKRMIDPDFWLDEDLAKLSPHARLLYIGLWNICDDNYATFPNRPDWIKIQVFPYEEVNVRDLLDELSASQKILPFDHAGKTFFYIKNFFRYQKIDRPSLPKYPGPPRALDESSTSTRSKEGSKGINKRGREYLKKVREELGNKLS
jgi:hypothetical protein